MQPLIRLGESQGATSQVSDNFMASSSTFRDNTNASVPRGSAALEQIQAMGFLLPHVAMHDVELFPPRDNTVYTEEAHEVEGEYTTSHRPSGSTKLVSDRSGYSTDEWEAQKLEIYNLYMKQNLPLSMVMTKMAKNGFDAKQVKPP